MNFELKEPYTDTACKRTTRANDKSLIDTDTFGLVYPLNVNA